MDRLTEKEKRVYEYLVNNLSMGKTPTVREVGKGCAIASTSTIQRAITKLCSLGLIEKDSYSSRSLRLPNLMPSVSVPILGKVTAGVPILAVEQNEGFINVPQSFGDSSSLFALKVTGLSMKNAGILDGDIVVADKGKTAISGDIVVALIEDEATVKRLKITDGVVSLLPENPDFEPIIPNECKILGTVTGSFRKY